MSRRVVLTGGPGAGKTTVLAVLAARGHAVQADCARALIRERQAAGLAPRPDAEAFARAILARDLAQFDAPLTGDVFYERGAVDALGMLAELGKLGAPERALLAARRYHSQVFVLPPWPAIYVTDHQRDQSFEDAQRVHGRVVEWYQQCGYTPVAVPEATPEARADFILAVLGPG
jgi:predicted ATPase